MLRNLILRAKASVLQRLWRTGWANRLGLKANLPGDPSVLVNSFYKAAFGRLADPEGLANRIYQLQSGMSLEVLAEELVGSAEFQTRHGSSQKLDAAYLTALYCDGLGHEPDPAGLADWLAEGEKGATRGKALAAFAGSAEAINRGATPLVNSLFFSAFGRAADEEELANNLQQLQSGISLEVLAEELVGSAEFQTRHGTGRKVDTEYLTALYRDGPGREPYSEELAFWLAEGEKGATQATVLAGIARSDEVTTSWATALVNSLYKTAFGRFADLEGRANRIHQLQSGVSPGVLAEELVGSAEFQTRHGSNQKVDIKYIAALYRDGLGREPDPEGLADWLAAGAKGATRAKVLAALASSDEAIEKARAYYDLIARLFDERYYLEKNASVASAGIAPFRHYRTIGWREGCDPNPLFDTGWYLASNPDAVSLGIDPLEHYCRYGWRQGLSPSPHFDSAWYLKAYQDVAREEMEPLTHYLKQGLAEGRFPRSLDREIAELRNRNLAKWIDECCTQFLSSSTGKEFPEALRETVISNIRYALAAMHTENLPEVSIVVPVHNNVDFTLISVASVLMSGPRRSFELIVADDVSTDDTQSIFECLPKPIRYLRWNHSHGFLKSCNAAAKYAGATYLVLLNNDTIVFPRWLDSLIDTLQKQPDAGLVGSKLLFASGRLQEAGGIIWNDASGMNFGRDDDPFRPEYNYLREVDYCSGCSLAIPKDLWTKLGGFDERFAPAYYEDVDLCFRIRQSGMKVFYQPLSKLIHFQGVSSGTSTSSGAKAYQEINRPKFLDRWSSTLRQYGTPDDLLRLADRYSRGHILVVDGTVPTPDQDAGSLARFNFLRILKQLNKRVTFVPGDLRRNDPYASLLEEIGIECFCFPAVSSLQEAIFHVCPEIEFAFLYRVSVAKSIIDLVRCHASNAKIVFNSVDLHFLPEKPEAELTGGRWRQVRAENTKRDELEVIRKADATIVLNESERVLLNELVPTASVYHIGLPIEIPTDNSITWDSRRDIVFVGGFNHPPNADAVLYFVREVWPILREQGYSDRFIIVGSNMPIDIKSLGKDQIIARGYGEDLAEAFETARVSVAPLRFGAGLKGKVASSLGYGVPCVTTSIGLEGSGLLDRVNILVGDTPQDLASHILRVYNDRQLWTELSQNGLRFFRDNYSLESIGAKFEQLMTAIKWETESQNQSPNGVNFY